MTSRRLGPHFLLRVGPHPHALRSRFALPSLTLRIVSRSPVCFSPRLRSCLALVTIALFASTGQIISTQDARQIVAEAQKRTDVQSQRYEGTLQVFDARGKTTDKRWEYMRIGSHGRSKAVLRFTAPAEVKGVALLIVNHPDRASDQWMWTPAIARERRIALQDRSTRFFGTDFSFEDLEERDVDQFEYRLEGTEALGGSTCWKIASAPRQSKTSQYTRSIVWIRQDNYTFAQIENFVRDEMVRRLKYSDLENVQGIWTAKTLEMFDARRNSRTVLRLDKLQYNLPMKDEDFTLQALKR